MVSAYERGLINESHPECLAWLERMHNNPSFQRATEKDGRESMVLPLA